MSVRKPSVEMGGKKGSYKEDVTVCLGSVCTVEQSFEGFNSGTGSSFIYHPAGHGEHARGCSKMKVCESAFPRVQTQHDKKKIC